MSLPTLNLKTATPDEINAAVAEHVAGWTRLYATADTGLWPKELGAMVTTENGWMKAPGAQSAQRTPDYLTDANAVLSLLYRTHWEVNQTSSASHPIRVRIYLGPQEGSGEANNLPRAACIALLRASGKVTVLD